MATALTIPLGGTLGTNKGAGSDGVLVGSMTAADPSAGLLKSLAMTDGLCYADDGGAYTNLATEFNEATADDVPVLPATPANDDAIYFGHASKTFARVDLNLTTDGDGTWTITYQYWDGDSWEDLSDVVDGTSGFVAGGTGWMTISFTEPEDWARCTVDGVLGYWIRGVVSGYSAVTTQPTAGQGYIVVGSADATWTDDTTDLTDAGAGDVALLPAKPVVGDGFYFGYTEKFCKLKVTTSQERTGTATLALKYWDGESWTAVTTVDDDSVGWSTTAGTLLVNFVPPDDWTANTAEDGPNGEAGYFVVMEITALTSVTQQPLATQGWVYPLKTGASGVRMSEATTIDRVDCVAITNSGSTGNSVFLVINTDQGTFGTVTWTKATSPLAADIDLVLANNEHLAIVQVAEDGSTEFAGAFMTFRINA